MIITATGWTRATVDEMTMADYHELLAYWADHPPLHILAAAYFGIKPKTRSLAPSGAGPTVAPAGEDLTDLLRYGHPVG